MRDEYFTLLFQFLRQIIVAKICVICYLCAFDTASKDENRVWINAD